MSSPDALDVSGKKNVDKNSGIIDKDNENVQQSNEKGEKAEPKDKSQSESTTASSTFEDPKDAVYSLARTVTQQSLKDSNGEYINPFLGSGGNPSLDPQSGKFSARAWCKALLAIQSRDPERYPERTAGIAYKNLSVHGFGVPTDYQKTFGNYPLEIGGLFQRLIGKREKTKIQILKDFDGLVRSGEMLVVLGRPGSGCSTLLKTIAGETNGFFVDDRSHLNYQGITAAQMHHDFRGECIYQAEVDVHFPQMTVGQTLGFAARARGKPCPSL
jgi:ATP-binding cassette subfamily G (WHITE) protein 2 (PDR)